MTSLNYIYGSNPGRLPWRFLWYESREVYHVCCESRELYHFCYESRELCRIAGTQQYCGILNLSFLTSEYWMLTADCRLLLRLRISIFHFENLDLADFSVVVWCFKFFGTDLVSSSSLHTSRGKWCNYCSKKRSTDRVASCSRRCRTSSTAWCDPVSTAFLWYQQR